MENLEQYIKDNLEQINNCEMPQGHKQRFMAKLQTPQRRKITFWNRKRILSITTAAAVAAIIISPLARNIIYNWQIKKCVQQIRIEESQIMQMLGEDEQYMVNNLKTITEEAVPLADQLPPELSQKERTKILIQYYKAKTESLKKIKTLYAMGADTETDY